MIKDLQEFGKWLNDNNQVDFGKNIHDDDYIFTIFYANDNFSLGTIDLKENVSLDYYSTSCFNDDLFHSSDQNVIIPSLSNLFGFTPFFVKLKDVYLKNNKSSQEKVDSFKKIIERSIKSNKNNKDFVSISNLYLDDLEMKFINVCALNNTQKENMEILSKNFSSDDISELIIRYYEFIFENHEEIIEKIQDFIESDKFTNKKGKLYLACVFGDIHDLINDFFYLYSNFLQIRSKKYKDYENGKCSICGNLNITYPTPTYFNLDNVSFNMTPKMENSKLKLCKNCCTFVKYADDKLFKRLIKNNHIILIPKIKFGTYDNFLKIANKEINSFEKINEILKECDNFNFDLLIVNIDKGKNSLITIKRYVENYKAFLVQFENLYLYDNKSMYYLFNEELSSLENVDKHYLKNTFNFENIFKEFFIELDDDGKFKFPNFYHFYEIFTKDLTGRNGIFNNFSSNTITLFSQYCENIFSFIYELNLEALTKQMLNEIVLNSILIFQKNNAKKNRTHILKRLNYYFLFKKEFLEDKMLLNENVVKLKKNFGKHDSENNVIFGETEKDFVLNLIKDDPAIKYYLLGQFISNLDILKKNNGKNKDIFSNYISNINRNNIKKLFISEILQKNNFYIEKMGKKAKFIFAMFEMNLDKLFNESGFDYEDYLILIFTGYYTENILLTNFENKEA